MREQFLTGHQLLGKQFLTCPWCTFESSLIVCWDDTPGGTQVRLRCPICKMSWEVDCTFSDIAGNRFSEPAIIRSWLKA